MIRPFQQTPLGCAIRGFQHLELSAGDRTFGLEASRSRRPPWRRILRLVRFGRGLPPEVITESVHALRALSDEGGVRRVHIEGWTEDPATLEALSRACDEAGFETAPASRTYQHTLWVDLRPDEDEILASFHASGRRNIRAPEKKGYEARPITDPSLAPHLDRLHGLAFSRTGGTPPHVDWKAAIRASTDHPDRMGLVGLFQAEGGDGTPFGFAMGFHHGEVAEYAFAGSSRIPGSRLPILYLPTWELMRWARAHGALWWDFGGVPSPRTETEDDPRSGITDFKRYFGGDVVRVGGEWIYEPERRWGF